MARTLQYIEGAYRANLEEQDDPSVWMAGAVKAAGADLAVLLAGSAVNYAVKAQDATGLSFGGRAQTQPPRPADDLSRLIAKGVEVSVVADDAAERGLERTALIDGIRTVSRSDLPKLFADYDRIWRW